MASKSYLGTKDIDEIFPQVFNKRLPCINKGDKVKTYEIKNPGYHVTVNIRNGSANVSVTNIYR